MRKVIRTAIVAAAAALGTSWAVVSTSAPAEAAFRFGGGGFHGGGFHGGFGGYGWRGYGYRGYGYGGYGGYGGWWWPGFATGAIIGAAAAYPYYYGYPYDYGYPYYGAGYGYGYGGGCWVYRRVYNRWGHYIGRRLINIC
jgi:hypothetical protein